jgi:hypothetical protein
VLYTAVSTATWTVEGAELPDEGRRRFTLSAAVLLGDLALMLLPPVVGALVLLGLVR